MRRVLIVDDSALVRASIQNALERFGFECGHAEHGQAALTKARSGTWDLIFLDVVMPVMDGPTALRALRDDGDQTPVVLVTSVSTAAVVSTAIKLGNVQYIAKPFTPDLIVALTLRTLRLDPTTLPPPPRVLVQHTDPGLPVRLTKLLPPHVVVDTSPALAESVEIVGRHPYAAVLLESDDDLEEVDAMAGVLRANAPVAGVFAISERGRADAPWSPSEALDGVLPRTLDAALIKGFLYGLYVRPLVTLTGTALRIAGYQGPAAHHGAYLAAVERLVLDHCQRANLTDVKIDARHLPLAPDEAVTVIARLDATLRGLGIAPAFRIHAAVAALAPGRLERTLLLAA
jgi:CheY-like chemotaxis protein